MLKPSSQTQFYPYQSDKSQPITTDYCMAVGENPPSRYLQLWSQLTLQDSVLCFKVKHSLTAEEKLLSRCRPPALSARDSSTWLTMLMATKKSTRLQQDHQTSPIQLLVGIAKNAGYHCTHVSPASQTVKALVRLPVPLQPIVTRRPWEHVGVDILKFLCQAKAISQYLYNHSYSLHGTTSLNGHLQLHFIIGCVNYAGIIFSIVATGKHIRHNASTIGESSSIIIG